MKNIIVKTVFALLMFVNGLEGMLAQELVADTDEQISVEDENKNWVFEKTYRPDGQLIGASVDYYNSFGKPTQSHSRDFKTGKTWLNEVRFDEFNRAALSTYSAPREGNPINFSYKHGFMIGANGHAVTRTQIYNDPENPPLLDATPSMGTLNWYYSDANTSEPYQDVADQRPYIRNVYDELNPGTIRAVAGGKSLDVNGNNQNDGLLDQFPQGFQYTMPVAQELYYAYGQDYFDGPTNKSGNKEVIYRGYKTVTIDAHGNENVVFINNEGQTMAAAHGGGAIKYEVISLIGTQGFVDVHIPRGTTSSDISFIGGVWQIFTVWDLRTGEAISPLEMTGGHIYRVVYSAAQEASVYISPGGQLTHDSNAKGLRYKVNYRDYALNYYSHAGHLRNSVQPLGFDEAAFNLGTGQPSHTMSSSFSFNASGELKSLSKPDEGTSKFIYRTDSQIRFSKNDKQQGLGEFSYSNYDDKGRPIESGVCWMENPFFPELTDGLNNTTNVPIPNPDTFEIDDSLTKERTYTHYDTPDIIGLQEALDELIDGDNGLTEDVQRVQTFVAGNVSKTWTEDPETNTTWYSYDIYGRVMWIVQKIEGLGVKTIDYTYDRISGNILRIDYQKNRSEERFIHRYSYNDTNQLTKVETSQNGLDFETQMTYSYYETGAMKRSVLSQGLQFTDYVYNLEGKLKAINHPIAGNDDLGNNVNDTFSLTLEYYDGDYLRGNTGIATTPIGVDRYDGNIKATRWGTKDLTTPGTQDRFVYGYNSKNWLTSASFGNQSIDLIGTGLPDYSVSGITYDPNGNIKTLRRTKGSQNGSNAMDHLTYNYESGTNQLTHVDDSAANPIDDGDIKDQEPDNYVYNDIGQLIENKQDNIAYSYFTNGLVKSVHSSIVGEKRGVEFEYNDRGGRIRKSEYDASGYLAHTYYVRDASGKVIAIYPVDPNGQGGGTGTNQQIEFPIYGSSRIGMADKFGSFTYELTDHLGNVRAVIQRDQEPQVVYFENFDDNVVDTPPWHDFTLTSVTADQERLKADVTDFSKPNSIYLSFNAIAHRRYEISFTVDMSETQNSLIYGASPNLVLSSPTNESQSGTYTFEYVSLVGGMDNIYFGLTNLNQTRNNRYYLDNVKITDMSANNVPVMIAAKDYYPFGMAMPERNDEGQYRYAFQGQEKDPETGKEAFELRLWDARIGRWLTTDPYGQFSSPYLGMGNDPVNGVDLDGGLFGRLRAWVYKLRHGGEIFQHENGSWVWSSGAGEMSGDMNSMFQMDIGYTRNFGFGGLGKLETNHSSWSVSGEINAGFNNHVVDLGVGKLKIQTNTTLASFKIGQSNSSGQWQWENETYTMESDEDPIRKKAPGMGLNLITEPYAGIKERRGTLAGGLGVSLVGVEYKTNYKTPAGKNRAAHGVHEFSSQLKVKLLKVISFGIHNVDKKGVNFDFTLGKTFEQANFLGFKVGAQGSSNYTWNF